MNNSTLETSASSKSFFMFGRHIHLLRPSLRNSVYGTFVLQVVVLTTAPDFRSFVLALHL